jgi:cation diffusion facilitator family transporter
MSILKQEQAKKEMRWVTNLSIVINLILVAVKFIVGILTGSLAMIADCIHSLSDFTTDVAVLLGIYFGTKKPDESHPYGHGRLETFAAGFIAVVLVSVGGGMIYYAGHDISRQKVITPTLSLFAAAVASIVLKEVLYQITKRVAVRTHSAAVYANAWHHRSDAFSSVAVLIGYISLEFGFRYGDQVAAMAVGLMIIWVGFSVIGSCIRELTEGSIDSESLKHINRIIADNEQIRQWHKLRSRSIGREIFLDLHILVDPELNITEAHKISENLERALDEQMSRPVNITVHMEPDLPELRK